MNAVIVGKGHCPNCNEEIVICEEKEENTILPRFRITICLKCLFILEYEFMTGKLLLLSRFKYLALSAETKKYLSDLKMGLDDAKNHARKAKD